MSKFDIIKIFDEWRWKQDTDVYDYEIETYCFDTKLNGKSEEERIVIAKKILLTHHLLYICDRQMDYRSIFYYGGYVVSRIVEDFFNEFSDGKVEEKEFKKFIENHTEPYPKVKDGKKLYSHYLKVIAPNNDDLKRAFAKKYNKISDEKEDIAFFASRMTIIDYCCIFRTLNNYEQFIDTITKSSSILGLAENLFKCTYQGVKNVAGKEEIEFLTIYENFNESIDDTVKFEDKKFDSKRLWCVVRDFLYHPIFKECFKIINRDFKFDELNKEQVAEMELPGDVWNNNSQFANCVLNIKKEKINSSKEVRKIYNNDKEKWGECTPIHFDITFSFVPRMCSVKNCSICPLAEYSEIEEIRNRECKDDKKEKWQEKVCHGQENKYCTLALATLGFKYRCEGKQKCKLLKIKGNK